MINFKTKEWFMKLVLILIATVVIVFALTLSGDVEAFKSSDKQKSVEDLFKSSSEPTAKDAVWTASNIFKVGVIDDNTSRDGYAMHVCEVLNERGFHNVRVQIIDIVKLARDKDWIELGKAGCN